MRHLNYNHLLYFWAVAREGSITKATTVLHLTPQTISGQLKLLEEAVGEPLFTRAGRGLVLSEMGHLVFQYADEIFTLGEELSERIKTGTDLLPTNLRVGITNAIPKLIAMRILEPAVAQQTPVHLACKEGELEQLLSLLAIHQLDMVISDCALPTGTNIKAFTHTLGSSKLGIFAQRNLAKKYTGKFPSSINDARFLLPATNNSVRRSLEDWFEMNNLSPKVIAEFEDSALMKAFGEEGLGLFPSPVVIKNEIESMYKSKMVGEIESVHESYFAISPERKLKNPIILEIIESARSRLFKLT